MSKQQPKLKRPTVKCHGLFDTNIKVNGSKKEVAIRFVADQDIVDLNVLGRMLKERVKWLEAENKRLEQTNDRLVEKNHDLTRTLKIMMEIKSDK